jgi:predicted GNAT family acetyltransferase
VRDTSFELGRIFGIRIGVNWSWLVVFALILVNADSHQDELSVEDNVDEQRYEARLGSEVVGFIAYRHDPGVMTLIHTEVDPALEGKGIASRLVAGALDDLRRRGLSVVPLCPFVRAYLRRHPEDADLVASR